MHLLRCIHTRQRGLLLHLHLPQLALHPTGAGRRLLPGLVFALGGLRLAGTVDARELVAVLQEILLGALALLIHLKIAQLLPMDADLRLCGRFDPLHTLRPVTEPSRSPVRAVALALQLLLADWHTVLAYLPRHLRRGLHGVLRTPL